MYSLKYKLRSLSAIYVSAWYFIAVFSTLLILITNDYQLITQVNTVIPLALGAIGVGGYNLLVSHFNIKGNYYDYKNNRLLLEKTMEKFDIDKKTYLSEKQKFDEFTEKQDQKMKSNVINFMVILSAAPPIFFYSSFPNLPLILIITIASLFMLIVMIIAIIVALSTPK